MFYSPPPKKKGEGFIAIVCFSHIKMPSLYCVRDNHNRVINASIGTYVCHFLLYMKLHTQLCNFQASLIHRESQWLLLLFKYICSLEWILNFGYLVDFKMAFISSSGHRSRNPAQNVVPILDPRFAASPGIRWLGGPGGPAPGDALQDRGHEDDGQVLILPKVTNIVLEIFSWQMLATYTF
jgi:hypothetical protein